MKKFSLILIIIALFVSWNSVFANLEGTQFDVFVYRDYNENNQRESNEPFITADERQFLIIDEAPFTGSCNNANIVRTFRQSIDNISGNGFILENGLCYWITVDDRNPLPAFEWYSTTDKPRHILTLSGQYNYGYLPIIQK